MKSETAAAAFRLPTCPYPGLRPFLDHEASLLQGRGAQIDEVIRRLGQTGFVAVVGGSGSGKSSLIRAGVVPRLRAMAISEAGQYWVPVVFTPGTSVSQPDTTPDSPLAAEESGAASPTPISRLAWKFDKELSEEVGVTHEARRSNIASLMRLGSGFSRIVDVYAGDLPDEGVDRKDARFLFVIDQFEELFDFSNRNLPDAKRLVDALIGHFARPDPRVYVVITMRSERLADCAAYLELPEAINRSMYLLRRLNDVELRDAIVGPAKSYLRLCQRARNASLPRDVVVEPEVVEALLSDVNRMADDADHLPLLQHLLARMWRVACERENRPVDSVPAALTKADLELAALPNGLEAAPAGLIRRAGDAEFNRLRSSLDHWAQLAYERLTPDRKRPPQDRQALDDVLRRLGYRDPNNGLYFQDRFAVDDRRLMGGAPDRQDRLWALLERGFLDEVNYLHWDDEDQAHQTLKVSHEAFIRGWQHFRRLIDKEADRFEEFMSLLRRCNAWEDKGRPVDDPQMLLERAELGRIDAAQLPAMLAVPSERVDWFKAVAISRDGRRLALSEPAVDDFVQRSRELRAKYDKERQEADDAAARNRRGMQIFGGVALAALTVTGVLWPVVGSVEGFASARVRIERLPNGPVEGATLQQIGSLIGAGQTALEARRRVALWYPWSRSSWVSWIPLIGTAGRLPDMTTSEPLVNGRLRDLLTSAIWRSEVSIVDAVKNHFPGAGYMPRQYNDVHCTSTLQAGGGAAPASVGSAVAAPRKGTLFVEALDGAGIPGKRGLLVPSGAMDDERESELAWYPASFALTEGKPTGCAIGAKAVAFPLRYRPRVLLDARLQYLAAELSGAVTVYDLSWREQADRFGQPQQAGARSRWVSVEQAALKTFNDEFGAARPNQPEVDKSHLVRPVVTWREPGGYGFWAGGNGWRILERGFQYLSTTDIKASDWVPLGSRDLDSRCANLSAAIEQLALQPGFRSEVRALGDGCIEIKRGRPTVSPGEFGLTVEAQSEQIYVNLYDALNSSVLDSLASNLPAPVASIDAFMSRPLADAQGEEWVIGPAGPYDGWIGIRRRVGAATVVEAAPLTTGALLLLADKFCKLGVSASRAAKFKIPKEAERCQPRS